MSRTVDELVSDHDTILNGLDVLSRMLSPEIFPGHVSFEDLEEMVLFLQNFADRYHHGKEEGSLFPAMIAHGVPDRGGPIAVMMAEHIQGRGFVHEMDEALDEPVDLDRFSQAGSKYISLLRSHIQKENSVLFPMAERLLPATDLENLTLEFSKHTDNLFEASSISQLRGLLNRLDMKYS